MLRAGVDGDKKTHSITKEERKLLRDLLVAFPLTIEGLMDFDRAVIADGGIDLHEVDMKTFSSKKIQNLFVTGDLLHINRPSGGFSLQLCWTTGYVAGTHAGTKKGHLAVAFFLSDSTGDQFRGTFLPSL